MLEKDGKKSVRATTVMTNDVCNATTLLENAVHTATGSIAADVSSWSNTFWLNSENTFGFAPGQRKLDRPTNLPFSILDCTTTDLTFWIDCPFRLTGKFLLKFIKNKFTNLRNELCEYEVNVLSKDFVKIHLLRLSNQLIIILDYILEGY